MRNEDDVSIIDQKNHSQLVLVARIEQISSLEQDTTRSIHIHQYAQNVDHSTGSSLDRSENDGRSFDINLFNHKSYRRKQNSSKSESMKKRSFNPLAYCMAYCTTIIIGTTIGGWIGGLFEFIFSGNHGCSDVHNGHLYCENKYASGNISTSCVNIFYKNSIMVTAPYICLCRFRNQSNGKYRDCDFLHAKIR